MANTGYKISPTVKQYFTTGPNSGSEVSESFNQDLTIAPFSASLDNELYFYRSYNTETCPPGYETCLTPLLTGVNTGSLEGRFEVYYTTQSSNNLPLDITASISNTSDFLNSELFSSSIGNVIPITSSFVSGTVYFKAFTSCSGPDPSPDSFPITFNYNENIPINIKQPVNIIFSNNINSSMDIEIRSYRGNVNYTLSPKESITYDYSFPPSESLWSSNQKSEDLEINIKGGSKNSYGNKIQKTIIGDSQLTYTIEGGFNSPKNLLDESNTFVPDVGINFKVKQLSFPLTPTTTTFTLLIDEEESITPIFGSIPYSSENSICAITGINSREVTYYKKNNFLYSSRANALNNIKTTYSNISNYILIGPTTYLIVNKQGYITAQNVSCTLPSLNIFTKNGPALTKEEGCKRFKNLSGTETFSYKDNTLVNSTLSGRYPLYSFVEERGGQNVILSNGKIIAYENCGNELIDIQYSNIGFSTSSYNFNAPENISPLELNFLCSSELGTYSKGPSGVIYYNISSSNPYIPLGDGGHWYKNSNGEFDLLSEGLILSSSSPC